MSWAFEETVGQFAQLAERIGQKDAALVLGNHDGNDGDAAVETQAAETLNNFQIDDEASLFLRSKLQLTIDETAFLWATVALSVDAQFSAFAQGRGASARDGLSVQQFVALFGLKRDRAMALARICDRAHAIRKWHLLRCDHGEPTVSSLWHSDENFALFLRNELLSSAHGRSDGIVPVNPQARFSAEQKRTLGEIAAWCATTKRNVMIVLEGQAGSGKRTAIAAALAPKAVFSLDCASVGPHEAAGVLALHLRDAMLCHAVPVLANFDELWDILCRDPSWHAQRLAVTDLLRRASGVTLATSRIAISLELPHTVLRANWPMPDSTARNLLWQDIVVRTGLNVELTSKELGLLAHRYHTSPRDIERACAASRLLFGQKQTAGGHLGLNELVAGLQNNITEGLRGLAAKIEVTQNFDELVLPPETAEEIAGLIARVKHSYAVLDQWGFRRKLARGAGTAVLFSGPPGTGKTMVAGLIAKALNLELYQVDLSNIVSKWVGETEKNLSRLFDAAETGHALLLFDEADSLFAKRSSEVKSATDRYANLEVNYLLQRVESFGGTVVLTTNLDNSIDPALKRRLAAHIVFGKPEQPEREALWRTMLNANAPLARDIDVGALAAQFEDMTGANIRNAALAAAYFAASQSQSIGMAHLLRAARNEYRSMGRVLSRK